MFYLVLLRFGDNSTKNFSWFKFNLKVLSRNSLKFIQLATILSRTNKKQPIIFLTVNTWSKRWRGAETNWITLKKEIKDCRRWHSYRLQHKFSLRLRLLISGAVILALTKQLCVCVRVRVRKLVRHVQTACKLLIKLLFSQT